MKWPGRWLAVAGFFLWVMWKAFFSVGWLEFSIGFSIFVLVPLLMEEALKNDQEKRAGAWLWQCLSGMLPFSLAGALSLTMQAGWNAAIWGGMWFLYTGAVAVGGVWRLRSHEKVKVEELCIDIGFIYLVAAGLFLFTSRLPISHIGPFSTREMMVLALLFHGVVFLLALITGFFGRYRIGQSDKDRQKVDHPYRLLVGSVLISPMVGFFSLLYGKQALVLSVVIFTLLIVWMCGWWFWLPIEFKPWVRKALVLSIILGFSMVGGALWKGLEVNHLSSVGILATIPPYGFFSAMLFSWLVVFAWRGVSDSQPGIRESE